MLVSTEANVATFGGSTCIVPDPFDRTPTPARRALYLLQSLPSCLSVPMSCLKTHPDAHIRAFAAWLGAVTDLVGGWRSLTFHRSVRRAAFSPPAVGLSACCFLEPSLPRPSFAFIDRDPKLLSMSTFPGLVQPKRKRNPKALQLSAEALSPRSGSFADDKPAPVLDVENPSAAQPPAGRDDPSASSSTAAAPAAGPSTGGALSGTTTASKISRKKPAGLDISRSIPTRPAPTPSASSTPTDRIKRSSGQAGATSSSSSRSRTASGSNAAGDKPSRASYQQKLTDQLASLHLGGESGKTTVALRPEDLKVVGELGCGNGGTVTKALHGPSGLFMARKVRVPRLDVAARHN